MSARSAPRRCTRRRRWPATTETVSAAVRPRGARGEPTTWPGRSQRLRELGDRAQPAEPAVVRRRLRLGLLAGRARRRVSLGFVVETERQVEHHLPSSSGAAAGRPTLRSRAIVEQMQDDEARHARGCRSGRRGTDCRRRCAGRCGWPRRVMTRPRTASDAARVSARRRSRSRCSISAVLPSITLAEQYLSCDSAIARSTAAAVEFAAADDEVHVDAGEHLGIGRRPFGAELAPGSR